MQLLQLLAAELVVQLEQACSTAIAAVEAVAGKQEQACTRTQRELLRQRRHLQRAVLAGKQKMQARVQQRVAGLEERLFTLKVHRAGTLQQLAALKRDMQQCMCLALEVSAVHEAAGRALQQRAAAAAALDQRHVPCVQSCQS